MSKEKVNTKCQSCGMPLTIKGEDNRGLESDGGKSLLYCQYCYENGGFTKPHATLEEIHQWGKEGIKASPNMGGFKKKMVSMFYSKGYLKKLGRWNKKEETKKEDKNN